MNEKELIQLVKALIERVNVDESKNSSDER